MQLDKTLFFRKPITPWYDSNLACGILITLMIVVFAFAFIGMIVGYDNLNFVQHAWFPGLLAFLSLFLVIKIFLRLRKRSLLDT